MVDPSGNMSLASLGTSLAVIGSLTTISNVGITTLGVASVGGNQDPNQIPDAAIFTLGGSVGSGGAMAEAGGDLIVDFQSGRAWFYGSAGVGLSPISLFNRFRSAGATKAVGLIWNFNDANEWSGFALGANWPVSILHLLPAASFRGNKMWGAMTQLAKREHNVRSSDLTMQIGVSTAGPVALRVSQRSNSFSTSVGYASQPVEVPMGAFYGVARELANDFGNALDEF